MKRSLPLLLLICATFFVPRWSPVPGDGIAFGGAESPAEDWKAEFDVVCSKSETAMTLSAGELKELVDRCDRLKPRIEAQEGSTRKVYLRRLQMCRDLYLYVLEAERQKK